MCLVTARDTHIKAKPVARFSLLVRSIPTIRGGFDALGHLVRSLVTGVVLSDWIETRLKTARLFDRGICAAPVNTGAIECFKKLAVCVESLWYAISMIAFR